jgi:hypothetical protein
MLQAAEVLGYVANTMLKAREFTLRDGTACRVDDFKGPTLNADGKLECAFDVSIADGSHLAFKVGHTGWGKSFAAGEAEKKTRRTRER